MKVLLPGAGGKIGSVIANELSGRGHTVTAAYREMGAVARAGGNVTPVTVDARSAEEIARVAAGHDAVVSAVGPGRRKSTDSIPAVAAALIGGLTRAGVRRLLVVGGAGTLETSPGVIRLDAPGYPEQFRPSGLAQKAALEMYEACDLDWTYVSPPIMIQPGKRLGTYRIGGKEVLYDADGKSRISIEDFAVALCDVLEAGNHIKCRITVGY